MVWLFLFLLFCFVLFHSKWEWNEDYLGIDNCYDIKGVFILMVLFSHATQYIEKSGYNYTSFGDFIIPLYKSFMGQLIVAMFLFYSGYGVSISISKKGIRYINQIPRNRVLVVLLNFMVAVAFFVIVNVLFSIKMEWNQILMSLIGWDSVGNSNWYIFVILLCYIITYVSFKVCSTFFRKDAYWVCVFIGCFVTMVFLSYLKPSYWYNTILCYPAGVFYFVFKRYIESFFKMKGLLVFLFLSLGVILLPELKYTIHGLVDNIRAICFAFLIVILSMHIKIGCYSLRWCGKNLFPLYIYQRLPMIIIYALSGGLLVHQYPFTFILISLLVSVFIAYLYHNWAIKPKQ